MWSRKLLAYTYLSRFTLYVPFWKQNLYKLKFWSKNFIMYQLEFEINSVKRAIDIAKHSIIIGK